MHREKVTQTDSMLETELLVFGYNYSSWKKSCTTWDVENPVHNGINYLPTGAGFLPSTVRPLIIRIPIYIATLLRPINLFLLGLTCCIAGVALEEELVAHVVHDHILKDIRGHNFLQNKGIIMIQSEYSHSHFRKIFKE